eukprot:Gregarina_sp_Pseudo_9__5167@NODE_554_length_2590_cov_45_139945_g523_i0_p1_GENE_NODE_554_length_2590_cov_45_139945_g523_i0NODE_554_length_2590_cov_45_139945_g523_i0_p1_ORF_typecomplete_len711_score209_34PUF/PF00806_19/0_37PUF/PF00806_19/2_1e07PUF/PF00806_19/7_4e05PUF/PF00806_19/3_2e09PUF/PF00806_19/3_4e09PUF/PF00806_19/1_6e08PUF/PF00806_19/1_2e05PUF/PF00806_19/0_0002OSCP/PF00213_18/1_6e03OSCP/PF00213_18/0_25DUF842/PF05811_13/0_37DUF842/PF05811_13/6e02HSM3_N/PF18795_1/5_1HSM3_N/PF18795_1/76MMS19_C
MASNFQSAAASEMLHQLLEVSVQCGPSTTTTSTGGDTWEDLSTASRGDPASPSRASRLAALTDSFPPVAQWPQSWTRCEDPVKPSPDDLFGDGSPVAGGSPSAVNTTDGTLPALSSEAGELSPHHLLLKDCGLEETASGVASPPGFVSPALLAHALNVLGSTGVSVSAHDVSSSFGTPHSGDDSGVAEAAQLLAQLLECSAVSPAETETAAAVSLPAVSSFGTARSFEDRSPVAASPQSQRGARSGFGWGSDAETASLRLPPSPSPRHLAFARRESGLSTPRSPNARPPPPPQDEDSARWTPWQRWPRPPGGDAFAVSGDAVSPSAAKRLDSATSGSPTNSLWPQPSAVDREGRSKVLTDFRSGTLQITNLYQIEKYLIEFSRDQMGARFIQQRLSCCSPQEAWFARNILTPRLKGLVTDVFGNHIVQRLIESGTPQQRHAIFQQLQGDILRFSLQTYGCRVLQKSLEALSLEDKLAFARELHNHVVRCVEDQNGNHVIQKCIERIPPAHMQFVIDAFQGQVARVSVHCYGCRVVQRVLEHCPFEQINGLLDEIMEDFIRLAQDQYGNYVVQHVLRYGRPQDKKVIVDRIAKDLQLLASHKFSSNVVEKCLEVCTAEDQRRAIIRAAFGDSNDPRPPIMQMVRDRYANYVVQRMIDVTIQDGQEALIDEVIAKLEKHMPALKKFTYGKHIAAALERLRKQNEELRSRGTS